MIQYRPREGELKITRSVLLGLVSLKGVNWLNGDTLPGGACRTLFSHVVTAGDGTKINLLGEPRFILGRVVKSYLKESQHAPQLDVNTTFSFKFKCKYPALIKVCTY